METPEPTPIRPLSFADRFWAHAKGPETEDVPEPLRSVVIVRHLLAVLEKLEAMPRHAAPAMVALLRQAEIDGDLSYASPEQVRGEILDTRSVVFSIGVVLFERLTGRHPFGAENNRPRRIDRIRKGELGSGVNSFPTVAAGLRSVLVRAMSPFPEERWPDLRQMRELLAQFVASESPSRRLPGTQSDVVEQEGEPTRVVRLATDFGRELMQVVAKHDQEPEQAPRGRGPRPSQRIQVPTSGVGAVGGGHTIRRPSQATPQAGVFQLRSVPPPPPVAAPAPVVVEDSVDTEVVDVDPHGATVVVAMPMAPLPPPIPPPPSTFSAAPQALSFDGFESIDLRSKPKSRTALIAGGSAVLGGILAIALFVGLRSSPAAAPAAAVPAPTPLAVPAAAPLPGPVAADAPALDPGTAPAPAAAELPVVTPPAPVGNTEGLVSPAIASCLTAQKHARVFGLSLAFHKGTIRKPYFDGSSVITPAERGCIGRAIKGLSPVGAPQTEVVEYRIHADAAGLTMTPLGQ